MVEADAAVSRAGLPIAVFDSGVGGLTVLHECLVSLPEEDYLYLGDDARFYGARTNDELRAHVEQVTRFLLDRGAKLLVIACNSAASAGQESPGDRGRGGVEVVAVIDPRPRSRRRSPRPETWGPGDAATVRSGSYLRALSTQHRALTVTEVEAPDWRP
jgi:glutamate racemase